MDRKAKHTFVYSHLLMQRRAYTNPLKRALLAWTARERTSSRQLHLPPHTHTQPVIFRPPILLPPQKLASPVFAAVMARKAQGKEKGVAEAPASFPLRMFNVSLFCFHLFADREDA